MAAYRRRVVSELVITLFLLTISTCYGLGNNNAEVRFKRDGLQNPGDINYKPAGRINDYPAGQRNVNNKRVGPLQVQERFKPNHDNPSNNQQFKIRPNVKTMGSPQIKASKLNRQIKLSDTEECADDVRQFCHEGSKNNFAVLDCLQNDLKMEDEVSLKCQNFLWHYKHNLTKDNRFAMSSKEVCSEDLRGISECESLINTSGFVIPCLVENIENVTSKACQQYLAKMSSIVFSDYRLIYKFATDCKNDIEKYSCGRIPHAGDDADGLHNQGMTIDCLAKKMRSLEKRCKKQVLRTLELQSDDYHLDRPLFYACRDDREHFCSETRSGGGRVYECLYKHMASKEMSINCRQKLEFRQKLISEDVKIDKTFFTACKHDIEKYKCMVNINGDSSSKRAAILLCLETQVKNDRALKGECIREMKDVRRTIMEDFNVNPNLVAKCGDEITQYCSEKDVGGKTIHCLMALARPKRKKNEKNISPGCFEALKELIEEADIGNDYKLDKVLLNACERVINRVCPHSSNSDDSIMDCLMDNLDHDEMTTTCEERLLEIQYFVARDFRLDNHLYRACKKDAKNLCNVNSDWFSPKNLQPEANPLVLPCLYRHMKSHSKSSHSMQVSRGCKHEVRRVMRQRAKRVDLEPEIEEKCMSDLSKLCSEDEDLKPGEEIVCLQDNYDDLQDQCKEVIGNFTESEDEDYEMDTLIMKSCTPMIKTFCAELLENDADPTEVLECLIEHKNHHSMNSKCAAGIEHHQLISLKDFRFNHKFKEHCQTDVVTYCKNKKTKLEVVSCLSEHVRNDTLLDNKPRISKKCRKQLKVELLQREESINLDPALKSACSDDVKKHCKDLEAGKAVIIECLKSHQKDLTKTCHKLIFKREKDDFVIADYGIATACKKMIQLHCDSDDDTEVKIMDCLKKAKDEPSFDNNCRTIVLRRQIAQSHDFRLNPQLRKLCKDDIPKFCKDVLAHQQNDEELEGKVINCLKKQFSIKRLSRECSYEIGDRIKESAADIRLAPQLASICRNEIQRHCRDEVISSHDEAEIRGGPGRIQECLKRKFLQKVLKDADCKREIAFLIEENKIDVNVDPALNAACQTDIVHKCQGISSGEGKIMSCLLSVLEDNPKDLTTNCRQRLAERKQMWEYAAQVAPPESFQEVYDAISQSPAKAYFLGVLAAVVAVIFIIGITCGRVTKRIKAELKNR